MTSDRGTRREAIPWQGASLSSGGPAHEHGVTDLDGSTPDCWRYIVDVQDKGRRADATSYR